MGKNQTKHESDWKEGFLFLGNQAVLDFLNTRPIQNGRMLELIPDFSSLLRWFHAAGLLESREAGNLRQRWGTSVQGRQTVVALHELRERLREDVMEWEHGGKVRGSTIEELNKLMARHPMRTRVKTKGNEVSSELYVDFREPADLAGPLAYAAATLFAGADRKRVRKCDQCILHFHDVSKKGTRRWCSMQLCGNRQKVAAYAARQRQKRH